MPYSTNMRNQFDLHHSVIEAYTFGDCGYLALGIHALTGYPLITASIDTPGDWVHVAVLSPQGLVLDVEGWWEIEDWLERWLEGCEGEEHGMALRDTDEVRAEIHETLLVYTGEDPIFWAKKIVGLAMIPLMR